MNKYDAIIVGGGHNGLVAAVYLAKAGWSTLVLERNREIGGAVRSGEITLPGFIHDLYSTNQNLFVASPVYKELKADLERHGLEYCISPSPYSNVFPDGKSLRVYSDQNKTLELMREHNPEDARGWDRLHQQFKMFSTTLLPFYSIPLPSLHAGTVVVQALKAASFHQLTELTQIVLSSTRELGINYFESPEARALIATWGMHLDFGPDVSGGGMFPFLESFADMENGMAIARGGASKMVEALAGLLKELGGEIRTEAEVTRIITDSEKATAVELASGERINAGRAVIANLTPNLLFGKLLKDSAHLLPDDFKQAVKRYDFGPGTMMVHLALKGPLSWRAGEELAQFAYVHIPPYVEDLANTYTQALNGLLPDNPLLIVGQTSSVDPGRAPGNQQVLWIQVRTLPSQIKGDAAGKIQGQDWDEVKEVYADRVITKLEQYAPGVRDLILDRVVYSPLDLERQNPNLHGGDSVAGSHHLRQNFIYRPFPGWSNYHTPVKGLYMVGAATWPGAGTNATSGYLAAREMLQPSALVRVLQRGGELVGSAATSLASSVTNRLGLGNGVEHNGHNSP